ncbi:hypothetical protein F4774DRAFT_396396 [Daldinia eschscholtzii]|nr:hypothetical protein F4774DRAFT_396396 [Daldinia eschscholtzii]
MQCHNLTLITRLHFWQREKATSSFLSFSTFTLVHNFLHIYEKKKNKNTLFFTTSTSFTPITAVTIIVLSYSCMFN